MTQLPELKAALPPDIVVTDPHAIAPRLVEWRDRFHGRTELLLKPRDVDEVALVLQTCNRLGIGVVPQGGNTGLCGGAIPSSTGTEVLLSLERLDRVRELDPLQYTMTAEAGCVLATLQEAAREVDRAVGISLAAEGSCQLGGCLSTNAGGLNVVHYGTTRDQVLGLEVVLPDGRLLNLLRSVRKDNTGYDLKQLFIGAEGTLGVITAATIKLYGAEDAPLTVALGLREPQSALAVQGAIRSLSGVALYALELMPAIGVELVAKHIPGCQPPFRDPYPWVLLARVGGIEAEVLWDSVSGVDGVEDGLVANNENQGAGLWRLRESMSEAQKREGASLKHDLSVPLSGVPRLLIEGTALVERIAPGCRVVAFGHVGDGNIHFNVSQPESGAEELQKNADTISHGLYELVDQLGGSFSAEHGIGQLKRDLLERYRSPEEIHVMRSIKAMLDPSNIMNPNKVIP